MKPNVPLIEQNPEVRYGFYLRPSYAIARAQAEIHDLLRRQYGFVTAGNFMPHATIKGFFRSEATLEELVDALDLALQRHRSFPVWNHGPMYYEPWSIVLNINDDARGRRNQPLHDLHVDVVNALQPFVHPNCAFTARESDRNAFHAHLTLLMADCPDWLFDEVWDFVQAAKPIGESQFTAEALHLFAFHSEAWDGRWGPSLTWDLLHAWRLQKAGPPRSGGVTRPGRAG